MTIPAEKRVEVLLSPPSPPSTPTAPPAEQPATLANRRGQTLLAGFTAAHFSHHLSNSLLNPLLPFIRDSFALTYAQSGFLVSAFALSLGFSNAPIGVLADRVGPRPVIAVGLILTALVSAALAYAQAYWQLLALLVLLGIIAGSYHAPASALISRAFPVNSRGAAIGLHITGGHLSFFATPVVAAMMIESGGTWRDPYFWLAIWPLLTGVLIWYIAPRQHQSPGARAGRWAIFRELVGVFKLVGPLVSTSLVFQMVYAALMAFTALYLVDARGVSPVLAAVYVGVPQLVGVLAAPFGGALSDRLGRRTVILIGMAGVGTSHLLLTLAPLDFLVAPLLAIGLTASLRQTVTEVLVMDSAPAQRRATVLGSYYLLSQELGGLAAPLLGILAAQVGIAAAFPGVCIGFAVLSGLVVLVRHRL